MKIIIIIAAIGLFSCSTRRYIQESVVSNDKEVQCKLIVVKRTMKGIKHTFVTVNNDTVYRYYNDRLNSSEDSCYLVIVTKLDNIK